MLVKLIYGNHACGVILAIFILQQAPGALADVPSKRKPEERGAPVNVIFDTDMWSDIDDALALAMLHALQDRHEARLVAVTISTALSSCGSYVDLVDTFYRHAWIPIGLVHNGVDAEAFAAKMPGINFADYTKLLSERKTADGSWMFPHRLHGGSKVPDAVWLLRKTLAAQPDNSVVVIQVGFSTNLARLLESPADAFSDLTGRMLVKKKVKLLSVMAGNFAKTEGQPEFNIMMDVPSAQEVVNDWPTPIVFSGSEIGSQMLFPAISIEHDFAYAGLHPVAEAYRTYFIEGMFSVGRKKQWFSIKWPHDHGTFDLTAVLYGIRPDRGYFALSKPGKVTVLADGSSRFDEVEGGTHQYLVLNQEQKARTLEAMVMLASEPPTYDRRTQVKNDQP